MPYSRAYFATIASRNAGAPHVIRYWLWSYDKALIDARTFDVGGA